MKVEDAICGTILARSNESEDENDVEAYEVSAK